MEISEINDEVIKYLEGLAGGGEPKLPLDGICHNLYRLTGALVDTSVLDEFLVSNRFHDVVSDASPSWDKFNGQPCYPVEGEDDFWNREIAFWSGPNGVKRRDLCQHVANYLKENPVTLEDC